MSVILIDILPAKGHFHATLKIANVLKSNGFSVFYGCPNLLSQSIQKFGYEHVILPSIPESSINFAKNIAGFSYVIDYFWELIYQDRFKELKKLIENYRNTIKRNKPDIVLLDEQSALKAFIYQSLSIKVIFFQTKPDTRKIRNIPPFTSLFIPKRGLTSNAYCDLLWFFKLSILYWNKYFSMFCSFGQDEYSMYKKVIKQYGIEFKYIEFKRSFGIGVKEIPRLVISPEAFDFPHSSIDGVFPIGPLLDVKREGEINMPRYLPLLQRIKKSNEDSSSFIVYCSLGTVTSGFKKTVKKFFLKIRKVSRINPSVIFVLSVGKDFNISDLFPAPDNLLIFDHVPQIDLLQYCNLMITHGGMNSINECVFNNVPMLVYPLSPRWDQPGNSARVVYHGMGLRGSIKFDPVQEISRKINAIRTDFTKYQKNVAVMKEKFEVNNNSLEVVDVIKNMLKDN